MYDHWGLIFSLEILFLHCVCIFGLMVHWVGFWHLQIFGLMKGFALHLLFAWVWLVSGIWTRYWINVGYERDQTGRLAGACVIHYDASLCHIIRSRLGDYVLDTRLPYNNTTPHASSISVYPPSFTASMQRK